MNWRKNIYAANKSVGAVKNPVIENPDSIDEAFAATANEILSNGVELIRQLIPSHQSAIAIIVSKDWTTVRKYFSLSEKYAEWKDYASPATGYGIHNHILHQTKPVRVTQAELEANPEWKNFGNEAGKHPPMRGWLAAPLNDTQGNNWGLVQLSDKLEGDYDETDEHLLVDFTKLVATALELAWEKRNWLKTNS